MEDHKKTKEQLISELLELRQKYDSLKNSSEAAMENDRILLNTIINNIPSSVFVKDKNYKKILANNSHILHMRAHLESVGLDPDIDIIGKTDFEVTSLKRSEEYFADDKKVIQFGESILNKEESGYNPEGEQINQIITKVPLLNNSGDIVGMVGITSDITELRQLTEELERRNEQLLKSNAEKDKFFSIIAHDLKSPFSSILGFSELIVEEIGEKDLKNIERYAKIILKSSSHAVDLLTNLMFWTQSQTGRIKFNPQIIRINDIIEEVMVLFDDIARHKNVSIRKNLLNSTTISADRDMLGTILRNIISNAIKFTYPGGEILISTELKEDELLVSVKDNGVGIRKASLKDLFEIDEGESTLGTQKEKGTGLGLILCKEFVEKHKGKIWAESQEGKGSEFKFTLPMNNF